jgi:hypothetical protein
VQDGGPEQRRIQQNKRFFNNHDSSFRQVRLRNLNFRMKRLRPAPGTYEYFGASGFLLATSTIRPKKMDGWVHRSPGHTTSNYALDHRAQGQRRHIVQQPHQQHGAINNNTNGGPCVDAAVVTSFEGVVCAPDYRQWPTAGTMT